MNYILYLGPDDIRGLIDYPEDPERSDFPYTEIGQQGFERAVIHYNEFVESIKSKAPKVLNIEAAFKIEKPAHGFAVPGTIFIKPLEIVPGDIFPLPEGYEFKKEITCCKGSGTIEMCELDCDGYTAFNDGSKAKTVLRIVKTDPKKNVILGKNSCIHRDGNLQIGQVKTEVKEITKETCQRFKDNDGLCQGHCYFKGSALKECSQPSPEESQKELFRQVVEIFSAEHKKYGRPDYKELESNFTIHRKK